MVRRPPVMLTLVARPVPSSQDGHDGDSRGGIVVMMELAANFAPVRNRWNWLKRSPIQSRERSFLLGCLGNRGNLVANGAQSGSERRAPSEGNGADQATIK